MNQINQSTKVRDEFVVLISTCILNQPRIVHFAVYFIVLIEVRHKKKHAKLGIRDGIIFPNKKNKQKKH